MAATVEARNRRVALRVIGISVLVTGLLFLVFGAFGITAGPADPFCPVWGGCPWTEAGPIWQVTLLAVGVGISAAAVLVLHRAYGR